MIKKISVAFAALAIAVVAVSLTAHSRNLEQDSLQPTVYYWQINEADEDDPLSGASYTQVNAGTYSGLSCSGDDTVCKLRSTSSTLPTTMTDSDSDGIPDVTGVINQVHTRDF